MSISRSIRNVAVKFHNDEDGMEALQVVIIIAIAAVILAAVKLMWPNVFSFFQTSVQDIIGFKTQGA